MQTHSSIFATKKVWFVLALLTIICMIPNRVYILGALSDMPAVKTFAIYATVALIFDFIFQITAFVALMSLDEKRFKVSITWM